MRKTLSISIALIAFGVVSAQQSYDYTQRQVYDNPMPPTFLVDGLRYHVLTDSTVEVFRIESYTYPGTHTVEVPPTVLDSNGVMYYVTRIAGSGDNDFFFRYWKKDTLYYMDTLYLPEGLEEIGRKAFFNTPNLKFLNIPSTVRVIEYMAFEQCGFNGMLELSESVELGDYVFHYSAVDSFVTYTTGREPRICIADGNIYSADTTRLIYMPSITVDTLVLLPTLRRIESYALRQVTAQTIILPEGLREIGVHAFNSTLQGLHIPASVCRIEGPLIEGIVPNSFQLSVDAASTHYTFGDDMLTSHDGDTLVMVIGNWTSLKILPDNIKVVGQYAFYHQSQLSGMAFPEGMVEIGPYAFAFSGCYNLHFPSTLERIGKYAFFGVLAGDLGEDGKLILPASLRDIGSYAFALTRCQRLKLSDSMTYVPEGLFWCSRANVIILGHNIEHIYPHAFDYTFSTVSISSYHPGFGDGLTDTVNNNTKFPAALPATLKTVGHRAFSGRNIPAPTPSHLAGARFEGAPDSIGANAFDYCSNATFGDTVPPVVFPDAFCRADTVSVPCGGAVAFSAAPGWGGSFTYVESPCPPPTVVEEPDNDGIGLLVSSRRLIVTGADSPLNVEVYDMLGRRIVATTSVNPIALPAGGVYLVRIADQPARKVMLLE